MKRCPYCAEEIQDEALKCRFCGEWLNKDEKPENIEMKAPEDSIEGAVEVNEEALGVAKEEESAGGENKAEEVPIRAPKQKIPWGWGWVIAVGFFGMGFDKVKKKSFSDEAAGYQFLIELLGIALVLLLYFWLRNRSIRKKQYAKVWHASFVSGFVSYLFVALFAGLLLGIVRRIDYRAAAKQFNVTMTEVTATATQWNQEEEKLWEQYVQNPDTAQGKVDSINSMKEILSLIEKRKVLMDRYFSEFEYFVEGSKDITLINMVQEMKKLTYNGSDTYKKGIESYIEYLSTGDEEKEGIALKLLTEVDSIREKQESLAAEIQKRHPVW
jgi:hypothetical protein